MNDLYLIGNGFDLAHGLKTSYHDFILWYLKTTISNIPRNKHFEDDLIIVDRKSSNPIDDNTSVSELINQCGQFQISIKFKHDFFKNITQNYINSKWVDIEYEYYQSMIRIYRGLEKNNIQRSDFYYNQIVVLNSCFDSIKKILVKYLLTIDNSSFTENRYIENILLEGTGYNRQYKGDKLYVNFNYTSTLRSYISRNFPTKDNVVNIHGELDNILNPIIFGYGDELDPFYEKIENLNENEYLKYIKSFGYFKTDNYQRIMRYIEGGDKRFTVKILGHSCGLSDRILLNTIFEHSNCHGIKIYYYQKSEIENDYFEKTQDISRHFKSTGKKEMRSKIVPFEESIPLVPFKC